MMLLPLKFKLAKLTVLSQMAEGGNPQNVFNIHMEGGGTFVAGDHVR